MRRISLKLTLALAVFVMFSGTLYYTLAHPGRTDANGGHYNRKTGEYHYHGTPKRRVATPTQVAAPSQDIALAPESSLPAYPIEELGYDKPSKVLDVIDGDTIKVEMAGETVTVRLIGVDTPETVHPSKPVEVFGKEASAFTRNLLLGEWVHFGYDTERTDKYGRTLAYVLRAPDGLFVNLEIVRQGYGHAYTQYPFKHMELFRAYERRAREIGKGLWADGLTSTGSVTEAQPVEAATPTDDSVTVYVTRTGKKYHRAGCRYLSKSRIPIPLDEARLRYGPCSGCNPPR